MKTHDKHRMLLDILPVALQGLGSPIVHEAIVDLSSLLRWVYMHSNFLSTDCTYNACTVLAFQFSRYKSKVN